MHRLFPPLWWYVLLIISSGMCLLVYAAVQQNYRQSANDPQVQLAQSAASLLSSGRALNQIVPAEQIDMATSLVPYIMVFGSDGSVLASSATLNGTVPTPPRGVFSSTEARGGEDRFTWQPQRGVRSAAVVVRARVADGTRYVLVGRSLREVESRISSLGLIVFAAWCCMMALLCSVAYSGRLVRIFRRRTSI